jgi:hypothetical protein
LAEREQGRVELRIHPLCAVPQGRAPSFFPTVPGI